MAPGTWAPEPGGVAHFGGARGTAAGSSATRLVDFYVEYELLVHLTRLEDRARIVSDLHGQILDAFNEQGVQIMSPHFERQPEKPVVVEKAQRRAPPAAPDPGEEYGPS